MTLNEWLNKLGKHLHNTCCLQLHSSNWDSLSCVEAPGGGRSHFCVVGSEWDLLIDVEVVGSACGSTCLKSIFKHPVGFMHDEFSDKNIIKLMTFKFPIFHF